MKVPMSPPERKVAIEMARQASRGGWGEAALADVLAALGLLSGKQAEKVAEILAQDPDPLHNPMCPENLHPARGNVYRTADGHRRCRPCSNATRRERNAERKNEVT